MTHVSESKGLPSDAAGDWFAKLADDYRTACQEDSCVDIESFLPDGATLRRGALAVLVPVDMEARWKANFSPATIAAPAHPEQFLTPASCPGCPLVEEYCERFPELNADSDVLIRLLAAEYRIRRDLGQQPDHAEYTARYPALEGDLLPALNRVDSEPRAVSTVNLFAFSTPVETAAPGIQALPSVGELPVGKVLREVDHYLLYEELGRGKFGIVYRGYDQKLQREVAIKVPCQTDPDVMAALTDCLNEARKQAKLEHPGILPVYDVAPPTAERQWYIVSRYFRGGTLAALIKRGIPAQHVAAEMVMAVAEALQYAHARRLTHRDIKPANILIGDDCRPVIADFGLALTDEEFGERAGLVGTPAYMSPEQARWEGHRVDGRSDIYALGIVFYELLTGRLPYRKTLLRELLEEIAGFDEVLPPRQLMPSIAPEVERICLKSLAKRAGNRYATAADFAVDLRHWLLSRERPPADAPLPETGVSETPGTPSPVASAPATIVPKGLRSFDEGDSEFFLRLLPGPRDRDGLPESVRFWKRALDETDPARTFSIGLLSGPSGCGKSSLMKAGVLPRLGSHVVRIFVEASSKETEQHLLSGLRRHCPELSQSLDLPTSVAALRRTAACGQGKKVLIVLDQFEQCLHGRKRHRTELVKALRHCDGEHVQCAILLREDFYGQAMQFFSELEIDLVPGRNAAWIDRFDLEHARQVLVDFGRAFGRLPLDDAALKPAQQRFLKESIRGLAEREKVACVRLSLFAEMMRSKRWTDKELRRLGGARGIGVTFLEETFSSPDAPAQNRWHQYAAQAVLRSLLPRVGTDIKGHKRTRAELLELSGYADRPKQFDELMQLLDAARLITPVDTAQSAAEGAETPACYQLTHDYLVHPLREWLTQRNKLTMRGRAELLLEQCYAAWSARPDFRRLPSIFEYPRIRWLTDQRVWTAGQRRMITLAGRLHAFGVAVVLLVLIVAATLTAWRIDTVTKTKPARQLIEQLKTAEENNLPDIVKQMRTYQPRINGFLRNARGDDEMQRLRLDYARAQLDDLFAASLWSTALDGTRPQDDRFFAACALAAAAPHDPRWEDVLALNEEKRPPEGNGTGETLIDSVAHRLVVLEASHSGKWREYLRPLAAKLIGPLQRICLSSQTERASTIKGGASAVPAPLHFRLRAADLLADYAAKDPDTLFALATRLDPALFPVICAALEQQSPDVIRSKAASFSDQLSDLPPGKLSDSQTTAVVALVKMGFATTTDHVLESKSQADRLEFLTSSVIPLGGDAKTILHWLDDKPSAVVGSALLFALGEFAIDELPISAEEFVKKLLAIYTGESDPGMHAAAEWLSRRLQVSGLDVKLDEAAAQLAHGVQSADSKLGSLPSAKAHWYVTPQEETMVVLEPGEVAVPETAADENGEPIQHFRDLALDHRLAIAIHEVTAKQFERFRTGKESATAPSAGGDLFPHRLVSWYEAAEFCNWLNEMEGIATDQWCYELATDDKAARVLRAKEGHLGRFGYRLPTEAEWEYACRAGSPTPWYFGDRPEPLSEYARYSGNAPRVGGAFLRTGPLHIAAKKPNDFGLFDMLGSVAEWCDDDLSGETHDAPAGQVQRMARGGSFHSRAAEITATQRKAYAAHKRFEEVGFRVVRTLPPMVASGSAP